MGFAVRGLGWRSAPAIIAGIVIALGGAAVSGGAVLFGASGREAAPTAPIPVISRGLPAAGARAAAGMRIVTTTQVSPLRRIVPPDLLVVSPNGITRAQLMRIRTLPGVRDLITADGGAIRLQARLANVLGVDPGAFRSWTPPPTAANERIWAALAQNEFVLSTSAQAQLRLQEGTAYRLAGASQPQVTFGASAALGIAGVNALVNRGTARLLGLVRNVAAMVNAPGANIDALVRQLRRLLGGHSHIIDLGASSQRLPVAPAAGSGRPRTYLELYKESAARYCPGLSWTVLAAIGQIESGHGANDGPSKAGALGPMQFLPSTWRVWGIPGFGDTTADIMNPYDAVPSAARYLCAEGAAAGSTSLYRAVYAYNHADWYVREVLALASEYAKQFG